MAVLSDVGNDGTNMGIFQPKLKNRWRVTFIGIGGGANGTYNGGGSLDADFLTVQAITASRPKLSFEKITLDRYNSKVFIAGKHSFDPMNLVFEDDTGGNVSQALQNQLESQQNIISQFPSALLPASAAGELYKFAIRIDMLDGNETVFESWSVEGCWIENIDYTDLDYAANESVKINLTVSFDHARQKLSGVTLRAHPAQGAF
jgi:hypothetical protein